MLDHPVARLADRYVDRFVEVAPVDATLAGLPGGDARWGDLGPDGVAAHEQLLRDTLAELATLPASDDVDVLLAVRVLDEGLRDELVAHELDEVWRDVAHLQSTVPRMRRVLDLQGSATAAEREALLERLRGVGPALGGWRDRLRVGLDRGVLAAARQVRSVAEQLERLGDEDGTFARTGTRLQLADDRLATAAADAAADACAAASDAARWLTEVYLPAAPAHDGVGIDRYVPAARQHLGTAELDPYEAHAWGLDRLRELWQRAQDVAEGIGGTRDVGAVLDELRADPAHLAPSPDAFREVMLAKQHDALARLDGVHVDVPAAIHEVDVRLATAAPPGAFYLGPAEDGSRPGTLWWSFGDQQRIPIFDEVSTGYHEGFPGHHLQIGTQQLLADRLTRAHRRLLWRTGYGEGWALYAEQLMDELGFLDTAEDELGYLTSELYRAVRVVTDTGLHLGLRLPADAPLHAGRPIDHEVATDLVEQLGCQPRPKASSEVVRQLGWPGQAISYALGQRTIVELREERLRRDGATYDARRFHADVLGSGPVGLDLLAERVRAGSDELQRTSPRMANPS